MKSNKDVGNKGFNSNHLLNESPKLLINLSLLLRSMTIHGFTPNELLTSIIISIPKDNHASLCEIENYRGIALFNCIFKVFDCVIICLCEHKLHTSDMQFSFKNNHSTTMCSLVYQTINCYLNHDNTVYS